MDIPAAKAFILHWGEMGSQWGVNRSVAQIHGLLYLSERPLHAEEIVDELGIARSNFSTAVKELQSFGIVRRVHMESDRRDHFVAETDLWEVLLRIANERKRREVDPTLALLSHLSDELAGDRDTPSHIRERIIRMHEFIGTLGNWYDQVRRLPNSTLVALMKLGAKVARFVPGNAKNTPANG